MNRPKAFLVDRVHEAIGPKTTLVAMCVGYEQQRWRSKELVKHAIKWIPEFALREGELKTIGADNMVEKLQLALSLMYDSAKFELRGDLGEILLHIVLRQVYNTIPAISKIYFTDSINLPVKGFDAVHVTLNGNSLELWLGEVKFMDDATAAARDVVAELRDHFDANYLRKEFVLIANKIDPASNFGDVLKKLINANTSLDEIFAKVRIPVLLTYDSTAVGAHKSVTQQYVDQFAEEVRLHASKFFARPGLPDLLIHLILIPLRAKKELVAEFDKMVKTWQSL